MKKFMMFVGAVTTGIVAGVIVKKCLKKDAAKTEETEAEDRGVSPVRIYEDDAPKDSDDSDDVPSLKADAINHGYKPVEY